MFSPMPSINIRLIESSILLLTCSNQESHTLHLVDISLKSLSLWEFHGSSVILPVPLPPTFFFLALPFICWRNEVLSLIEESKFWICLIAHLGYLLTCFSSLCFSCELVVDAEPWWDSCCCYCSYFWQEYIV